MLKIVALILMSIALNANSQSVTLDSTFLTNFQNGAYSEINNKRTTCGVSSYSVNATIQTTAQNYANSLAQLLQGNAPTEANHSPSAQSGKIGENMYWAQVPNTTYTDSNAASLGIAAVDAWFSEISNYNFSTGSAINSSLAIGHFTALAWKSSTQVGCGVASWQKSSTVYETETQYSNCQLNANGSINMASCTVTNVQVPVTQVNSFYYVVCNFMNPGNVVGQANYLANVSPSC